MQYIQVNFKDGCLSFFQRFYHLRLSFCKEEQLLGQLNNAPGIIIFIFTQFGNYIADKFVLYAEMDIHFLFDLLYSVNKYLRESFMIIRSEYSVKVFCIRNFFIYLLLQIYRIWGPYQQILMYLLFLCFFILLVRTVLVFVNYLVCICKRINKISQCSLPIRFENLFNLFYKHNVDDKLCLLIYRVFSILWLQR